MRVQPSLTVACLAVVAACGDSAPGPSTEPSMPSPSNPTFTIPPDSPKIEGPYTVVQEGVQDGHSWKLSKAVEGRDRCFRFEISIPDTQDPVSNRAKLNTGCLDSDLYEDEFIFLVGEAHVLSVGVGYAFGLTTSRVASVRLTLSDNAVVRATPTGGTFVVFYRTGERGPDIDKIEVLDASDRPLRTCRKTPTSGGIDDC